MSSTASRHVPETLLGENKALIFQLEYSTPFSLPGTVVLMLQHQNPPEGVLKHRSVGPTTRICASVESPAWQNAPT